jgi:RHS repeat-associated protein
MRRFNIRFAIVGVAIVLTLTTAKAQTLSGPTSVTVGQTVTYTYYDNNVYSCCYTLYTTPNIGMTMSTSSSGTTIYINYKFTSSGSATLSFSVYGQLKKTINVSATCPTLVQPSATFSYSSNTCGDKIITYTGTPPSGVLWYWQTTPTGNSLAYPSTSFTASSSGYYYLRPYCGGIFGPNQSTASVTVNPSPAPPTSPIGGTTCSGGAVTLSITAAGGNPVRWYNDPTAGNLLGTGLSYTTPNLTSTTTYYACSYNATGNCESSRVAVTATVSIPPSPSTPLISSNVCGAKTLSYNGTPPNGVLWYWQGTNSTGQDYTSTIATAPTYAASVNGSSTTYYIRSRYSSSGCWGTPVAMVPSVDNPPAPTLITNSFTYCEGAQMTLYPINGAYNNMNWYLGSQLVYSGLLYTPANLDNGSYTYNLKNVSSNNCEGPLATPITLQVGGPTANCDNFINWKESISYNYSSPSDVGGSVIANSRTYFDGFGKPIQQQVKSISNNQVFAAENIYDYYGNPSLSTLPAPINSSNFGYRYRFVTNQTGQKYSYNDFDALTGSGSLNVPNPIGNNGLGTLGWYYSSANSTEPATPTTSYPYSRSYAPLGPNPLSTTNAGPGDAFRMGGNHESKVEKSKTLPADLVHYYGLRSHFTNNVFYTTSSLVSFTTPSNNFSSFTAYQSVSLQSGSNYVFVTTNQASGNPGTYPINGIINVTPGALCNLKMKGYKTGTGVAKLHITDGSGVDILWGASIPSTEGIVESSFTVPTGVTTIKIGVQWTTPIVGEKIYISSIVLQTAIPSATPSATYGYRIITTDPDRKQTATFIDSDGNTLAKALVTSAYGVTPVTYGNWSYNYFNNLGQLIATVAPKGIIVGNYAYPSFASVFKYDHLGMLIETTSADEGTSKFVYSTDGKIRFSQNQEQRNSTPQRFSYSNYDYLGRLVETGEYTMSGTGYFVFETNTVSTPSSNSVLSIIDSNVGQGYTIETINSTVFNSPSVKIDPARCSDYSFIVYDSPPSDYVSDADHTNPLNLIGMIAKTQNSNSATWYSYDEFRRLAWIKQSVPMPTTQYKTVDYTYDFSSNVTQVAYQKGQGDSFYHHYTYNSDGKLTDLSTSFDGINKTAQAKYKYYLHGPLKRLELATNLQGIDYVYTINGALKSINHVDTNKDPGADGASNGFSADVFGQTLDYFSGDYTGANYTTGTFAVSGLTDYYGGLVKSASWFTPVDNTPSKKIYGYSYDNLNRFTNAQWGTLNGTNGNYSAALSSTTYNENITGYDLNGNITGLNRKDKSGNALGSYTYNYTLNTNKLSSVGDGANSVIYSYNAIGQMIQQTEGSQVTKVLYNAYNLVKEIRDGNDVLKEKYFYGDRNDLIKKLYYTSGNLFKTTYYVRDAGGNVLAVYDQNATSQINLIELPIYGNGRLGMVKMKSGQSKYFYEINDNLGNVRGVIGSPRTETITATMEASASVIEDKQFKNIAPRVTYAAASNSGNTVVRVNNGQSNGGYPGRIAGPGTVLTVAPGDIITAEVYAYYEGGTGYNNTLASTAIVSAAAAIFGGTPGPGEAGKIYSSFSSTYSSGYAGGSGSSNSTIPAGYLNFIMFDGNHNASPTTLPMAAAPVTNLANYAKQKLTIGPINIPAPGYVYIYVNNNSDTPNWLYFDDLKITQTHSPFVAGGDYYPFGLPIEERNIKSEGYRYGYQGQYSEKDSLSNLNEFNLRLYDARFGRWFTPDPEHQFASPYVGMGNNPVSGIDKKGSRVFYKTLIEAETTALDINSIFKAKYRIENAVSVKKKIIPGTKEEGYYLEFNSNVDIDGAKLNDYEDFIVQSFKNLLDANTDILGEIVDPSTKAESLGTVGSNKGYTFSPTHFKIPNNLSKYDPKLGGLNKSSYGSQTLHELILHISPAGTKFANMGYDANFVNSWIGATFLRMGSHPPGNRVNKAIKEVTPKFGNGSRKVQRTPRYRH